MKGVPTLWVQAQIMPVLPRSWQVEKSLCSGGLYREQIGRDEFYGVTWA